MDQETTITEPGRDPAEPLSKERAIKNAVKSSDLAPKLGARLKFKALRAETLGALINFKSCKQPNG